MWLWKCSSDCFHFVQPNIKQGHGLRMRLEEDRQADGLGRKVDVLGD